MGWMALLDKNDNETDMVVGDSVWDIMGDAVEKITNEYKQYVGRSPYLEELESILGFVTNRFNRRQKERNMQGLPASVILTILKACQRESEDKFSTELVNIDEQFRVSLFDLIDACLIKDESVEFREWAENELTEN